MKESLTKIEEAKSILPNYFEVYRVSAFVKATFDDYLGAEQDYKTGIEIESDNPRLLYFFSGFLLYQLNDAASAFPLAKRLNELRPNSTYPTFLYARCLNSMGQMAYFLPRWEKLSIYTTDARLSIDNNLVENAIRPVAIGRKNYLFAGSHEAAVRAAMVYSLLATCKLHNINPYYWLRDVLENMHRFSTANIESMLPQNWKKLPEV